MRRFMPFVSLALALTFTAAAHPAAAQCGVSTANVDVVVRTGTPPSNSTTRREQVRISQALATALCINAANVAADGENSPQVRLEITTDPTTSSTVRSTGLFTVSALDTSGTTGSQLRVEIWGRSSGSDNNNGLRKLFPTATTPSAISGAKATVYRIAPAKTVTVTYAQAGRLNPSTTQHYNEPANNGSGRHFEEYIQIGTNHDVAVLVPHGGDIETDISDHLWRIDAGLDPEIGQADVWEGYGEWGNSQTSRRWHITSDSYFGGSFPGLQQLIDQAPYDYAVSVHGFTGRRLDDSGTGAFYGIVSGGNANQQEKCYLVRGIQDALGADRTDVAVTIFWVQNGVTQTTEIPDAAGRVLDDVTDYRGLDSDNIANRLAPNANGTAGFGAFQFELSKELRDDATMLGNVMDAIGERLGELQNDPTVANNACSTLLFP
jgi:phage replication-related protein YjqB (UPF0714/DUF867 family)